MTKPMTEKKEITAWAVALIEDNFIPDFTVEDKFENVMQIHNDKKSAEAWAKKLGDGWKAVECKIII